MRDDEPRHRLVLYRGRYAIEWREQRPDPERPGHLVSTPRRASLGTPDRALAETRYAEYLHQLERGSRPPEPTLGQVMDAYLADREATGTISMDRLRECVKALRPSFANLLPKHVSKAVTRRYARERGVAPATVNKELRTLRAALNWAWKDGWIKAVPFVEVGPTGERRDRWLTREEADRLVQAAVTPHVRLFILLALHTAARRDAILTLTWDRVDMSRRTVDYRDPFRPQTAKGRAVVPMTPTLAAALSVAKEAALTPFVIEHGGKPVASVKKGFAATVRRAGISDDVTPHVLRHTSATWMAMERVPMRDIARYLGHRDSRTTEAVYAHHHPDFLRDAAAALEGVNPSHAPIDNRKGVSRG